ncbi:MAG: hypothetical protein QXX01_01400 [Candidatus Aenigmatarchaeota archaeon]
MNIENKKIKDFLKYMKFSSITIENKGEETNLWINGFLYILNNKTNEIYLPRPNHEKEEGYDLIKIY